MKFNHSTDDGIFAGAEERGIHAAATSLGRSAFGCVGTDGRLCGMNAALRAAGFRLAQNPN